MVDYTNKDFDINILGSFYEKDKTIFRVFAPETSKLFLVVNNKEYEMHQRNYYFEIALGGDLQGIKYYYQDDKNIKFKDPFAYYSDEEYSYVLDSNNFINEVITPNKLKDIIIYETSVRDFSCDESFTGENNRKFLALSQKGLKIGEYSIGFDYLCQIGITHLQLMPIFDFDLDGYEYNWGYNPLAFNYVKKDYVVDNDNPYAYINELRSVVNNLHRNNIRVTLDVVFNHVYHYASFDLDKMLPGHVLRRKADGSLAAGSLCGNEIKSEDPFVREYLTLMSKRYIKLFDIDGIRIDQMGILDYETINRIDEECKKIKHDFIVYGEGWNMGDVLSQDKRAAIINADKMPGIAMFNDYYRDVMVNYVSGNDAIRDDVKNALSGNCNNMNYTQSINYVECHDNNTFFDRMLRYKHDDPIWINVRRCKLALALVMVSRGLPFIHSGQEFLRTKNLVENSYNANETVNRIDWNRRVENNEICNYFSDLAKIRRENPVFISSKVNVSFQDYYDCIIYRLDNMMIIINPCKWDHIYQDGNNYDVIFDINGKANYKSDVLSIPAYSLIICKY